MQNLLASPETQLGSTSLLTPSAQTPLSSSLLVSSPLYTLASLRALNSHKCHLVSLQTVERVNTVIRQLTSRPTVPSQGDIVRMKNPYRARVVHAVLNEGRAGSSLCLSSCATYLDEKGDLSCNGGPFVSVQAEDLELVGSANLGFWLFGRGYAHEGGAIEYTAPVRLWQKRGEDLSAWSLLR